MREIKFRAWDMSDSNFDFEGYMEYNVSAFNNPFELHENGEIILMQFTGVKDKNGVDIYEGDIFRAPHDFGHGDMQERVAQVHFDILRGYQWQYWDIQNIEVIGNVYENPELIRK